MMNFLGVTFLLMSQLGDHGKFLVAARDNTSAAEKHQREIEKQKEEDKDLMLYPDRPELQLQERYRDTLKEVPPEENPVVDDAVKHGLVPTLVFSVMSSKEASEIPPPSVGIVWEQVAANAKKSRQRFNHLMPTAMRMIKSVESVPAGCSNKGINGFSTKCPPGTTVLVVRRRNSILMKDSSHEGDKSDQSKGEEGEYAEDDTKRGGYNEGSSGDTSDNDGSALTSSGKKQKNLKN